MLATQLYAAALPLLIRLLDSDSHSRQTERPKVLDQNGTNLFFIFLPHTLVVYLLSKDSKIVATLHKFGPIFPIIFIIFFAALYHTEKGLHCLFS